MGPNECLIKRAPRGRRVQRMRRRTSVIKAAVIEYSSYRQIPLIYRTQLPRYASRLSPIIFAYRLNVTKCARYKLMERRLVDFAKYRWKCTCRLIFNIKDTIDKLVCENLLGLHVLSWDLPVMQIGIYGYFMHRWLKFIQVRMLTL